MTESDKTKAIIALRRSGSMSRNDPPQAENPAGGILFYLIGLGCQKTRL